MTLAWLGGGIAGLIIGSFLATLVLRWPAGRTLGGRSACDGCGRTLRTAELVPLLSALASRGRCRSCGARIDPLHTGVEAGCGAIGAVALALSPDLPGAAGAVFGWLLVALALLDARYLWLPDRLTITLALTGLAGGIAGLTPALVDRVIGGGAGFAALWAIATGYRAIRKRDGLGGGDPKLFGAIGLWLGWQALPFVLLGASAIGLICVLGLIALKRDVTTTTKLPFGTMLAVAAFPVWVLSQS